MECGSLCSLPGTFSGGSEERIGKAAYVSQLVAAGHPVKLGTERRGITREIAYE